MASSLLKNVKISLMALLGFFLCYSTSFALVAHSRQELNDIYWEIAGGASRFSKMTAKEIMEDILNNLDVDDDDDEVHEVDGDQEEEDLLNDQNEQNEMDGYVVGDLYPQHQTTQEDFTADETERFEGDEKSHVLRNNLEDHQMLDNDNESAKDQVALGSLPQSEDKEVKDEEIKVDKFSLDPKELEELRGISYLKVNSAVEI